MNEQIERLQLALTRLNGLDPEELHGDFDRDLLEHALELITAVITDLEDGL